MMKRLDTSKLSMPHQAEWPANPTDSAKATLFTRRAPPHKIVAMIDDHKAQPPSIEQLERISGLITKTGCC